MNFGFPKILKRVIVLVLFSLAFLITPKDTLAVSISIDNYPASISDSSFTIDISVTGAATGDNYFKIDLYKEGTTSYFGETYNGSDWYNGSDGKQYFKVAMQSGQTSTISLQGKLGNPSLGEFQGAGTYKLKIRRHTSSGAASSTDSQNPVDVNITYTSPTPSPTLTPTPTPSPTDIPTPTLTPTPSLTPTPTVKPTSTQTPTPKTSLTPIVSPSHAVLGEGDTLTFSETFGNGRDETGGEDVNKNDNDQKKSFPFVAGAFIVLGGGLIGYALIPFFRKPKNGYNQDLDDKENEKLD